MGVGGRIILKWILEKYGRKLWTRCIWFSIGASSGLLWIRQWTFGFRKKRAIYWPAERLSASQELIELYGKMIIVGKDMESGNLVYKKIPCWYSRGDTDENHKKSQSA